MAKKQKSGLYRARIKVGINGDGTSKYKYISAKTQRELEDKRRAAEMQYAGVAPAGNPAFGEYAHVFFERKVASGVSQSSIDGYRTALNVHILPVYAYRLIRTITPGELQDFVNSFAGCSGTKMTTIIAAIKGTFRAAIQDRVMMTNPAIHIQRPKTKKAAEKRTLTKSERQRIVSVCASHPHGDYLAAMYYLGCRPGEARGLQWQDFNWAEMTVHIQRDVDYKANGAVGALKTEKSDRVIPVPRALAAILQPKAGQGEQFCFPGMRGGALSKTSAERIWAELMTACDMVVPVDNDRYRASDPRSKCVPVITPHALRHNYITMCWESGIDAFTTMRLVGHSSIKTTMDIYTHLSDRARVAVGDKLNDMFG